MKTVRKPLQRIGWPVDEMSDKQIVRELYRRWFACHPDDMDQDQPWFTLFERESRRFTARQFQISYADLDEAGQPKISLLCFGLEAHKAITQVLFFKFKDESASLKKFSTTLNINSQILQTVQADVAARLTPNLSSYIKNIEI